MPRSRAGSAMRFLLILVGGLLVLILAAGWMMERSIQRTESAAVALADRVLEAIQVRPRVISGRRTLVEQQSAVLQLVTTEKKLTERLEIANSWLHSTKTLEVEADFTIRAGFDLAKPFVVEMDRSGAATKVTLPPAEILSVEIADVRFVREEDGLWNRLTPGDREEALRSLRAQVAEKAKASTLLRDARADAERRLAALLGSGGRSVTFTEAQ